MRPHRWRLYEHPSMPREFRWSARQLNRRSLTAMCLKLVRSLRTRDCEHGVLQPMPIDFTVSDVAEARKLNATLDRLPRLRMKTPLGRTVLNAVLRIVEIYPLLRPRLRGIRREFAVADALNRQVPVRIFRPSTPCRGVIIDLHGGGWTIGNARMSDRQNASLAAATRAAVVSIDYRLAISVPIAAQVDDCEAAALWVLRHAATLFGTTRIVVKASSAGAHLAACMLLRLRDRLPNLDAIDGVILYFGLYDFAGTPMVRNAGRETLLLDATTVRETLCLLTPGMTEDQRRDPSISPLYAKLDGLPPALFIVGEEDMLLEDSRKMEARWHAASGNAELLVAPASPHAFVKFGTSIAAKTEAFANAWIFAHLDPESRKRAG